MLRHCYPLGLFYAWSENDPLPLTPGTMLCYFLFPMRLVNSGKTLIGGGRRGRGIPGKYFLDYFSLKTVKVLLLANCLN